ncbi:LysM peptidoglycan-binding domain-containing protein [Seohaeicola saemankumensis]|uniref:LysM peptidoglycan-binding domain-containing protein n=1 Tax=Seohaeicola saemankumensis TaxID=481181 RepID=A0ABW3TEG0_9RHOB
MFRALAIASLFAGVTVSLVLIQSDSGTPPALDGAGVTRSSAGFDQLAIAPAVAAPQALTSVRTADQTSAGQADAPPRQGIAADMDLQAMTRGVLVELGVTPPAPAAGDTQADDPMRAMSMSALSGLRKMTGQPDPAEATMTFQTLIARALQAGQSDAYIDALLNEAATSGAISVPGALVTAEGRVDTHVILSTIVAQAAIASGQDVAAVVPSGNLAQRGGQQVYTVGPGDSLGSIALRFYGDMARYTAIFEANRALLSSPDSLRVGQRLVIPTI